MRSRYTAYVRQGEAYLLRTWHPSTRPESIEVEGITWDGLEVLATHAGSPADASGTVSFVAHFRDASGNQGVLQETSRFEKADQKWLYVDGDVT